MSQDSNQKKQGVLAILDGDSSRDRDDRCCEVKEILSVGCNETIGILMRQRNTNSTTARNLEMREDGQNKENGDLLEKILKIW